MPTSIDFVSLAAECATSRVTLALSIFRCLERTVAEFIPLSRNTFRNHEVQCVFWLAPVQQNFAQIIFWFSMCFSDSSSEVRPTTGCCPAAAPIVWQHDPRPRLSNDWRVPGIRGLDANSHKRSAVRRATYLTCAANDTVLRDRLVSSASAVSKESKHWLGACTR